jgi:ribonuclease HI
MTSTPLSLIVYTDGGSRGNPGPAGLGVYICTRDGVPVERRYQYLWETTNNVAEYTGAHLGLKQAIALGATSIELRADSKLVIEQLAGRYKVKNPALKIIHTQIREMLADYTGELILTHVYREQNTEADRLSNIAMDEAKKILRNPSLSIYSAG